MKIEQYKAESAFKRALKECGDYWDRAMDNPRNNRFADSILIGLLIMALVTTSPYWITVGLIQISATYLRIKLERFRASRIFRTKDGSNE